MYVYFTHIIYVEYFQLVTSYLGDYWPRRTVENNALNVISCRLMLNLIPGLETAIVFESVSKMFILITA